MKEIFEFMEKNNKKNIVYNYVKKWKKVNRTMKKKEKVLEEAIEKLDYVNKIKNVKVINDVFINKRLFKTVKNVKSLIALRRLRTFAKEDKKNNNLKEDLIKAHKELTDEHKAKFMKKLYKMYTSKILDNFVKKLSEIQLKKALRPKSDFMNELNLIAINDKEFAYKHINKIEKQPKVKNLHFKKKEKDKEITEKDLLEYKLKSNVIAFNSIIPELLDYLNDIFKQRKSEAYKLIKYKARNEMLVKYLKSYVDKKYKPDKQKFYDELMFNKKVQETEGPLQAQLFKLLRRKVLNTMLDKDDVEELSRLLRLLKLFKITEINKELSEERWLRTLIRKWRFLAFSKVMSKKKLAYLYKHFHVNYLEMANNVFGEQDSNPSVIKEFERFGSNVGIWENEKPDYAEQIKHAKSFHRRVTFTAPSIFNKLIQGREKDKKEEETKTKGRKEEDKKEDEKEEKSKRIRKPRKEEKDDDEEEEEENEENEENEEEN